MSFFNLLLLDERLSFFLFQASLYCLLKHFMMVALKSSSSNSDICVILLLVSIDCLLIHFEIFLVLGMMWDFQLYPGYFEYYETRELVRTFWFSRPPHTTPLGAGGAILLLLVGGKDLGTLLSLLQHSHGGRGA